MVRKVFTQIFSFINVQLFNRSIYIHTLSGPCVHFWFIEHNNSVNLLPYTLVFVCSLLLRRECCSFSNGEYVKAGLAELEHWCYKATDEVFSIYLELLPWKLYIISSITNYKLTKWKLQYAGSAWDELKHIRQAIGFLVLTLFLSFLAPYIVEWSCIKLPCFSYCSGYSSKTQENIRWNKPWSLPGMSSIPKHTK